MSYTYLVPDDTKKCIHAIDNCQNLALILARYIPQEAIEKANVPNEKNKKVHDVWLSQLLKDFSGENLEKLIFANLDRWSAMIQARDVSAFQMVLRGRMAVGLGGKNPLEFGITLNKLTGLPYIPGSALKGLARSHALLKIAEEDRGIRFYELKDKDDNDNFYKQYLSIITYYQEFMELPPVNSSDAKRGKVVQAFENAYNSYCFTLKKYKIEADLIDLSQLLPNEMLFQQIFGTQADAGGCVFYDAVVSNVTEPQKSLFTMDVMTPHFVKYYTSGGTPHDGDNPNPVSYVVVREGISFGFAIGTRTSFDDNGTRKQARNWLRSALEEMGIGAKTAQGYGVFKDMRGDGS